MNNAEMVSIVNQVVEILREDQRKASLELAEGLNKWKVPNGSPKGKKALKRAYNGRKEMPGYYHKHSRDGLPSGVSVVKQKTKAWKVSFRTKYLGMYYDLQQAIAARQAAEDAWDSK